MVATANFERWAFLLVSICRLILDLVKSWLLGRIIMVAEGEGGSV